MPLPPAREIALPEASPERDAYRLLASANLLRIRGRWDEAVEQCMAAMRLAPDSATAQSLLGDIYENQGRMDDAVQWYRMALDVNPDSPADKIKLARLLQAKAQILDAPSPPPTAPTTTPRRARWTEPDIVLRGAAFAAGMLVLVIVALALIVMARHGPLRPGGRAARQVHAEPVMLAPTAASSPPASAPALPPAPGHDPLEQSLMERLRATGEFADADVVLVDLQSDPRAARLIVTVSIRPASTGGATRDWVLRQALRALQTAAREVDPQTASLFTVRCLLAPAEAASGLSTPLVFVGDAPRAALALLGADSATLSATQMLDAFQAVWWSPVIPS